MTCPINRETIANGIVDYASEKMDNSNLFDKKDELYYPKDESSNYQDIIDSINDEFQDDVVMQLGDQAVFAVAEPSDDLVREYSIASGNNLNIKNGVDFVFNQNPELSKVGTTKEYSQYIDSIFPDSKIKDIVYHGSLNAKKIETFNTRILSDDVGWTNGSYFSETRDLPESWKNGIYKDSDTTYSGILAVLLNLKNPKYVNKIDDISFISDKDKEQLYNQGYDSVYTDMLADDNLIEKKQNYKTEIVAFEPEQIHILGNKQDIEGFKEWKKLNKRNILYNVDNSDIFQSATPIDEEDSQTLSSKADKITKNKVLGWLEAIGFTNIKSVGQLIYKGQPISGRAYIDFINAVMQIVEGQEDYTLPEEAMTILLQLVKQSRPELYNQMVKEIINYKMYGDVLKDPAYKNNPLYQNEDGTLNYEKIKEEAVTKLLAEYLINQLEGTEASQQKLLRTKSWLDSIIQWVRELFGKYKNPFKEALEAINENPKSFGEFVDLSVDDIFLSAKSNDKIDEENKENKKIWESIKNKPSQENFHKVDNEYYKDGKKVEGEGTRVSNLKDEYYKKLFGNKSFDEDLKEFYDQAALEGTTIHEMIEDVVNAWIDPTTGLRKRTMGNLTFIPQNQVQKESLRKFVIYVGKMLDQYPEGTRFLTEQIIHDSSKNIFGTIDFLAVLPNGTIDILDWKSTLQQDIEGAKDYKKEGYYIQLNEYKRILKDAYGAEKFGKLRAIPIRTHHKKIGDKNTLTGVTIGDADPAKISKDDRAYRPIISPEESTGSRTRDEIIEKLGLLYQKYIEKGYWKDDRNILEDVQEAIYEIRTTNSVDNLATYFIDLRIKLEQILKEKEALKKADKQDVSEALSTIALYQDIITNVVTPSTFLQKDGTIAKESRAKLYRSASDLSFLNGEMSLMRDELLDSQAKKENIFNLLLPEKVVNMFQKTFRSMGSQNIASVRFMYELVKKAYNKITFAVDDDLKKLKDLKFDFEQWRKKKGLSEKQAIGMLVDFEKGRIHSKIDAKFYEARQIAFDSKDATDILNFVKDNYDIAAWQRWYDKQLEENLKLWKNSTYDDNKKKNNEIIRKKVMNFEKNYNILKHPLTAFGYHNKLVWSKGFNENKWLSPKYQEIASHPELLAVYNFFVEKNKQLADTGAIEEFEMYSFLPSIRKSFADIISLEDNNILKKGSNTLYNIYDDFRKSLTVSDYELNYEGARDPFTGKKLEKRFVPYISKLPSEERSFDIFKIYGLMSKEIHKEQYLQENDQILRSLVHLEKNKTTLQQNKFGKLNKKGGKYIESQEKGLNATVLEQHVRAIVNGEHLQTDADFAVQFRLRERWNKSPMGKLYQFDIPEGEDYKPTAISATKFILWMNNINQKRILGVNAASAISNLFGGSYSSSKLYKKYISQRDLQMAWTQLSSGAFYASEDMKKNAALLDYFQPHLENREAHKAAQLSVSDASKFFSQDWLMSPMRKTSEIVQTNIFLALIENTGIVEGKIVNLRDKAAQESKYYDRYSLSPSERKGVEKKFEDLVKKYKDQYGIKKAVQYKTITEGGKEKVVLEIPGISRNSVDVEQLRELSRTMAKDALGEADEFDLANYKYNLWWRLMMTFKNWIPRQVDVRFGEFRYSQSHHAHEYGRFRMFYRALASNFLETLGRYAVPFSDNVFGKENLIAEARKAYAEKKKEAEDLGTYNQDFISEGEFVDRFIQGVQATSAELRTITIMTFLMIFGLAAPDDDDDSEEKAYKALIRKQVDKLTDEISFFYSPKSGIDILGNGAPITSSIKDSYSLIMNVGQQFFGFTAEQLGAKAWGEKQQETAKPVKKLFKVVPVLKEILTYLPAMDDNTAKEWGVRVSDRRGF
jgi:hypothetical protein